MNLDLAKREPGHSPTEDALLDALLDALDAVLEFMRVS